MRDAGTPAIEAAGSVELMCSPDLMIDRLGHFQHYVRANLSWPSNACERHVHAYWMNHMLRLHSAGCTSDGST